MTKDELIKHMQDVIDEVIKQDEDNWGELLEAEEYEEIDLDKAWHNGYMSAIATVRNILND
jgi:hypothetical protein